MTGQVIDLRSARKPAARLAGLIEAADDQETLDRLDAELSACRDLPDEQIAALDFKLVQRRQVLFRAGRDRLPLPGGLMHVRRWDTGYLAVEHESSSGESHATLASFPPNERDRAVRFALDSLKNYGRCSLGEIAK